MSSQTPSDPEVRSAMLGEAFKSLRRVGGNVEGTFSDLAHFKLQSVGGDLKLRGEIPSKFLLGSSLARVEGDVLVHGDVKPGTFSALAFVGGDVAVTGDVAADAFSALETVDGNVVIKGSVENGGFEKLATVGGAVVVAGTAETHAFPALAAVGENFSVAGLGLGLVPR